MHDATFSRTITAASSASFKEAELDNQPQYPEHPHEPEGELGRQLKRFTFIVSKRKWWTLLTFLIVVSAVAVYTKRQTPVYRATASVIIESNPPRVLSGVKDVVELGSSNYWAMREYFQTQYKVITGLEVCERVVAKLHLDEDPAFLGVSPGQTLSEEERARRIADKVPARILQARLTVEPVRDSMMVLVSADDADPQRAAELANEVVFAYRAQNMDYRRAVTQEANAELRDMVERYRQKKEEADQELLAYEKSHAIGSFATRKQAIEERVKLLHDRQGQLLLKKSDLQARLARVKRLQASDDIISAPIDTILGSPLVSSLKAKLVELKDQRTALFAMYGEKHPKIRALDSQVDALIAAIRAEVQAYLNSVKGDYDEVVSALKEVDGLLHQANEDLANLGAMQVEYNALAERKKDASAVYDQVRNRYMEINLSAQVETNNVRIHELAHVPTWPLKPNIRLNLVIGAVMGLLLGLALAFLVEQLDNTVKSRQDVERATGVPCLGLVPSIPGPRKRWRRASDTTLRQRDFYVLDNPRSMVAEALNTIRTNLLFSQPDRRIHTLLVTSCSPWEGKSTIVIQLGVTMARAGTRTLLMDTDMRRPRLHRTFNVETDNGLSSLLLGTEPVESVIIHTGVPNLDLLPCGPVQSNVSDLLRMERLAELLVELRKQYDMVILDSPPVIPVADPRILSGLVEAVILVVKLGHTTVDALAQVRRELAAVGAPLVGTILNDLDVRRGGYGYGYGYSYGYYGRSHGYYSYTSEGTQEAASAK